jgi:hypothetical protein
VFATNKHEVVVVVVVVVMVGRLAARHQAHQHLVREAWLL